MVDTFYETFLPMGDCDAVSGLDFRFVKDTVERPCGGGRIVLCRDGLHVTCGNAGNAVYGLGEVVP